MESTSTYEELFKLVTDHIKSYRADLVEHDRGIIDASPGIPFLHWARSTGTTIAFLLPHNSPEFPPRGQTVPYLFGRVNRVELSQKPLETAQFFEQQQGILVHHFDGHRLRNATTAAAVEIARAYVRAVQSHW